MRQKKLIIVIILALAAAFLSYSINRKSAEKKAQEAAAAKAKAQAIPTVKKVKVVVLKNNLRTGYMISKGDIELTEIEESKAPKKSFKAPDPLVGRFVMKELAKGTILIDDMLFEQGVRPSLALFVPVGKRAVNVKISKEAALGGFARQNDHVDLLAVFDNKQNFDTPQIRLIATDAEVLSINSEFLIPGRPVPPQDPKQKDKQKQNLEEGKVVAEKIVVSATLIMSPEEAEKVVLASDIAKLYMVLRSPFENKDEYMQPVTQRDLVEMKRSELISMYGELLNMKLGEINNSEKLEDAKIKKIEVYKGAKLETGAASAVPAGGSK